MKNLNSILAFGLLLISLVVGAKAASALPLGGAFEVVTGDESAMRVRAEQEKTGRTRYKSTKLENETFDGVFVPSSNASKLAVLSDDGVTITMNGQATDVTNFGRGQDGLDLGQSLKIVGSAFQAGRTYQIHIAYSNVSYGGATDFDGMTLFAFNGGGQVQEVNLIISDGQGGRAVPDDDEETVGAFTVANRNDTDSDGVVDNSDNNVPGEKDLMALEISRPAGPATDKATVKVTSGSGRLWQSATKGTPVPLVNGAAEFTLADLPKTIYLEVTTTSAALRDASVELNYQGQKDTVKATGVWAQQVTSEHSTRSDTDVLVDPVWKDLPTNPKYFLNLFKGTGLRPINRLGFHNLILIKFQVLPAGVQNYSQIKFDLTRQVNARSWTKASAADPWQEDIAPPAVPQLLPTQDETANDDPDDTDESDGADKDGYLYVVDGPGGSSNSLGKQLLVYHSTFREFARVSFNGRRPTGELSGSRCSDKFAWHCRHYLGATLGVPVWGRTTGDTAETEQNDVGEGPIEVGTTP